MAITRQKIVAALNVRLKRAETMATLEEYIDGALKAISGMARWSDMRTSSDVAIVAGTSYILAPSGMRELDAIVPTVDGRLDKPLTPQTLEWIRQHQVRVSARGIPRDFCRRGNLIDLYPVCDRNVTLTVHYWQWHPLGDQILFSDPFQEAIYSLVQANYLEGKGLLADPKYAQCLQKFQQEISGPAASMVELPEPTTQINNA